MYCAVVPYIKLRHRTFLTHILDYLCHFFILKKCTALHCIEGSIIVKADVGHDL